MQGEATAARIGERLSLVRAVERLSQTDFAARAGIAANAWNNYETGRRRISIDHAIQVAMTYRLTLDYIYLGDATNLPHGLARAIDALTTHASPPTPRKS